MNKFDALVDSFLIEARGQPTLPKYTTLQKFAIMLWGGLGYLDANYPDSIPNESTALKTIMPDIEEYIDLKSAQDSDADDIGEWFMEGAPKNGKQYFSKNLFYSLLDSAQTTLTEPLTVRKFFTNKNEYATNEKAMARLARDKNRYGSWTTQEVDNYFGNAKNEAMVEVTMPVGSKVILADGLADVGEVIIKSGEILAAMNYKPNIKKSVSAKTTDTAAKTSKSISGSTTPFINRKIDLNPDERSNLDSIIDFYNKSIKRTGSKKQTEQSTNLWTLNKFIKGKRVSMDFIEAIKAEFKKFGIAYRIQNYE